MELFSTETLTQIISLPIMPVILLPVTGLALLVFYNRIAAANGRIRALQKELRDYEFESKSDSRRHEMMATLKREMRLLHSRTRKISITITCLLLSIFLFSLCALFAVSSLFHPELVQISVILWFCGPVLICIGMFFGLLELRQSLKTISMQTEMVEKWGEGPSPGD